MPRMRANEAQYIQKINRLTFLWRCEAEITSIILMTHPQGTSATLPWNDGAADEYPQQPTVLGPDRTVQRSHATVYRGGNWSRWCGPPWLLNLAHSHRPGLPFTCHCQSRHDFHARRTQFLNFYFTQHIFRTKMIMTAVQQTNIIDAAVSHVGLAQLTQLWQLQRLAHRNNH